MFNIEQNYTEEHIINEGSKQKCEKKLNAAELYNLPKEIQGHSIYSTYQNNKTTSE